MIQNINNYTYTPQLKHDFNIKNLKLYAPNHSAVSLLSPLNSDTLTFTGMSAPSQYKSVFDYLAADILAKNKKFQIDGSLLSAKHITKTVKDMFDKNRVFGPYTLCLPEKIKWKSYIPEEIRVYSTDKINDARIARLKEWHSFLQNPDGKIAKEHPKLTEIVNKNDSLKFIIWQAVNSEIKSNNRHIPVPFDPKALYTTIVGFEKIDPIDRAVRCSSPSFIEIYTHRLRDTLLENKGLSDNKSVWVKIPSIKSDPDNKLKNIHELEILSCRNWCTRSSVDKAEAALQDGDFYIYIERDKNNLWKPLIGMASCKGKIDQIQGIDNNNIIPINELKNIKEFILRSGLKCNSNIIPEGPKALQQIYIGEKLAQVSDVTEKTLEKAIKDNDDYSMLTSLLDDIEVLPNGNFEIRSYKPYYNANPNSGITIPYSMMGINEDIMLSNVERINGNFVLTNKNSLFSSKITKFPPNLKVVTGKIICSKKQFEMFKEDILRVTNNQRNKLIIHD